MMESSKITQLATERIAQRLRPAMDEDLKRLLLSLIAVLKRKYPNDYQRILKELVN
jgi:hypothetical protein